MRENPFLSDEVKYFTVHYCPDWCYFTFQKIRGIRKQE